MSRIILILAAVIALLIFNSLYIVNQTEQAIVLRLGKPVAHKPEPGLKVKIPFIENILFFDNRILHIKIRLDPEEVIALDRKRVVVDAFAKYRITDPLLFYKTVGDERGLTTTFNPILDAAVREAIGRITLLELLSSKRESVMADTSRIANEKASRFGVKLVDVRIRRTDLPENNSASIYRRMQTQHEKEARETRAEGGEESQRIMAQADREKEIITAEADKQAQIIRGRADAKATDIFADAFGKDKDFYDFYRSMSAYKNTMKEGNTTMILSPNQPFFKYMQ